MAPKHFRELQCWRLADDLRREVNAICAIRAIERDRRFCEGFRDATGSVCRNFAEGFARFRSTDIVQFFTYALASLAEVQDYLSECLTRQAIDQATHDRLLDLSEHAKAAAINFMRSHEQKIKKRRTSHVARRT